MHLPETLKTDFPIFSTNPNLVYLDSTASAQKPAAVIGAEAEFYRRDYANVHRGVYALSQRATDAYEGAREKVRAFINARSVQEIVYVRGTTEGINLVAHSYGQQLQRGDVVLLSEMEHHANIVPWQKLRDERGVVLRWIPLAVSPSATRGLSQGEAQSASEILRSAQEFGGEEFTGDLDLSNIDELLKGVKLVAVTQMSNVLGVVNDVKLLAQKAHAVGANILVDGAQSVPHLPVDVQDLDCDFLVFSGHKMCGPTGIGVLYAKEAVLQTMEPYQRGGDMILEVTKDTAIWNDLPHKFEAGTPNIAGAVGLGAAVDYLRTVGMQNVWAHDQEIARYGLAALTALPGVRLLGDRATSPRGAIFAFDLVGVHPHDIGSILDERGIAIRAGHHCTQPLHKRFGLTATTRASGYLYNTIADIDALVAGLKDIQRLFS